MKKTLAIVVTLLLALTLCVSLVACGGGVEGTYKLESMEMGTGSDKITIKAGEEVDLMGTGVKTKIEADYMTLTLNADKTAKMVTKATGAEVSVEGTWEEKDGKVVITVQNDPQEFKLENGKLILEQEGVKIVLAK